MGFCPSFPPSLLFCSLFLFSPSVCWLLVFFSSTPFSSLFFSLLRLAGTQNTHKHNMPAPTRVDSNEHLKIQRTIFLWPTLTASNVTRVKNRLTKNNIEICGRGTRLEAAEAVSVWHWQAKQFWHGLSWKIISCGQSELSQVVAFELPGVTAHSWMVKHGSGHSTFNTLMGESHYCQCSCYSCKKLTYQTGFSVLVCIGSA